MKSRYPQTILVIDDHEENIEVLLESLNHYDIIPALSALEAFEVLKVERVDLILLDIMMPKMDGYEMCKVLKQKKEYTNIPIIFLTAKSDIEDIKKGFEYGAIDYFIKPFNPIELKVRIATHLELISYKKYLENRIHQEVESNRLKQEMLFQKSKQAEIGELMMHISHQWKQPLSELGSINTFQMGKLENNLPIETQEHKNYLEKNGQIIDFMSQTVETFQNFYQPKQHSGLFDLYEAILTAQNIISATFNYNGIDLQIPKEARYSLHGCKNEYSQIVLAILSNAKNIFIAREIKHPKVKIDFQINANLIFVTISDNGGGIDFSQGDIFAPHMSLSNSTGVGLYMAKSICKKNLWEIETTNTKTGAKFIIKSRLERGV